MSVDCFPESEGGVTCLSEEAEERDAALPEKPDMEMLVKKALGAYYYQPQSSESYSAYALGDSLLFKVVAQSLEPPRVQVVAHSLEALLDGDEQEQRDTFEFLKQALDQDRPSNRKLFQ